jgi:cytochrome c oxidase subunit II
MDASHEVHSAVAGVDTAFLIIFAISAAILVLIVGAMVVFVIRYRRDKHPVAADIDGNFWAELIWIVVPTILVLGMFHYGWTSYRALRDAPAGGLEVKVTARMWSWNFTYPNGRKSDVLVVPVGVPVKLELSSVDVIHGFFVPAFRIKIDTVPGMTTHAWFKADKPGSHDIFCSVYCGLKHADMLSKVEAVTPEEYQRWLNEKPTAAANPGKSLMEKNGCLGCHSLDGTPSAGPTLKDVFGRTAVLVGKDGKETTLTVDDAYLKAAITGDARGTLKGFDPIMPSYAGAFSDAELGQIVAFLKGEPVKAALDGASVAANEGCVGCHSTDGAPLVGPSFKGLFGSTTTVLTAGKEKKIVVDKDFLLTVLADPDKYRTKGFDPIMPGYPNLSQAEKDALLNYLEGLGSPAK